VLEVGHSYYNWSAVSWTPVPGKDAEILPKLFPGCLDHQLGGEITMHAPSGAIAGRAEMTGYRVAPDGSGAWLRIRIISLEDE
jgi:hypothetical protein